jgi:hypothetical protein
MHDNLTLFPKGAIEVWDNKSVRKVAIAESFAASTFQWAPDSRHFLTAVLQDRMKGQSLFPRGGTCFLTVALCSGQCGAHLLLRRDGAQGDQQGQPDASQVESRFSFHSVA